MAEEKGCRIRLRWPSGAEFEAEGPSEFVAKESRDFLTSLQPPVADLKQASAALAKGEPNIDWSRICDQKGSALQLRAKLPAGNTGQEACLVLLACAQRRLGEARPTATQLAKWLRRSGYPVARMDRAMQQSVAEGDLLSSGSRRARRYELTSSGRLKALLLAEKLTAIVAD